MAPELDITAMACALAALVCSVAVHSAVGSRTRGRVLYAAGRMVVQLLLVGVYLEVLFRWNHPAITTGYIAAMAAVANAAVLRNSGLRWGVFWYTYAAFAVAVAAVAGYFFSVVFRPVPLWDARIVIPIAGMLLGNSMNRTIVTVERFYASVRAQESVYTAWIAMGATTGEAVRPFLRSAFRAGLAPQIATMTTMGLVSLPGMMTGQILGGSPPLVAVKYQVAIMVAILVATDVASLLCVLFSRRMGFTRAGFLDRRIFKDA